jgi:hypothetical protein
MKIAYRRASLTAAAAALIGVGACSNSGKPMDNGLKQDLAAAGGTAASGNDLELAPKSASSQMVISASEGGPTVAPARAAHKPIPKPTPKPAARLAANRNQPVNAPSPAPVVTEPAPSAPAPQPEPARAPEPQPQARAVEPPPLPSIARPMPNRSQGQQPGVYRTEGEVFKNMPWIKP